MPQWDFLELLAAEGRKLANFYLLMGTLATLAAKAALPVTARIAGRRFLPEKLHHERPRKLKT